MMEEKQLIGKLRELRQIKPSKDWVVLTKKQILGQEEKYQNLISVFQTLFAKPAYAGLIVVFVLVGLFGTFTFAQKSLPGDPLYQIKKISEKAQAVFVSQSEKPKVQLELANKRVEELNKIAETNQVQKLAPAIKEVQNSFSQATKNLVKLEKTDKEAVDKIVSLKKNLEKAETTLGTQIGSEEDEETMAEWIKNQVAMLIKELENRILTEKEKELLSQMKELVEKGEYSQALELYLISQ